MVIKYEIMYELRFTYLSLYQLKFEGPGDTYFDCKCLENDDVGNTVLLPSNRKPFMVSLLARFKVLVTIMNISTDSGRHSLGLLKMFSRIIKGFVIYHLTILG